MFHIGTAFRTIGLRSVAVTAVLVCGGPAVADEPRGVEVTARELVTPETQRAIDNGLAYLAGRQNEDGSFGSSALYRRNVAITALSGMAFLSAGHTPGRGRYGEHVQKTVDYVLSRTRPNGFISEEDNRYHGPMYGHGFATMFLAEVYGMSPRRDVREKLELAIRLIVNTQNKEGGWRYQPEARDADISVTVAQVMALRAARNAGIFVPKQTIDRSVQYIRDCRNADGGFQYQRGRRAESMFPRSAAAVVALYSAGVFDDPILDSGLEYLMRYLPQGDLFRYESHYFYAQYYAVQAMWHAGGTHWPRWYAAIREELLRRQLPNGGWPDPTICTEYGTAMACLVLQMPNNYLPIFQR